MARLIAATQHLMSRKEFVLLVSRTFALFLTTWALVEATYLPHTLYSLFHHLSVRSALATYDYWSRYYSILAVCGVFRMITMFLVAALFWRCGPWVQALFSPPQGNQQPTLEPR